MLQYKIAHALNGDFQNTVKSMVKQHFPRGCVFQEAPVKLAERSLIKTQVEYADAKWPRSARVVDLIRNSVTFGTCADMMDGLESFISLVHEGKFGCVKKILRIKNGFKDIPTWNEIDDFQYRVKCP